MPTITPNLWFDTQSEEAAEFYVSVFPNSKITNVSHYGDAGPREAGTVLTVDFELDGQPYTAINGGPQFTFDEAISLQISCADQAEIDYYWSKLDRGRRGGSVRLAQGPLRPLLAGRADRRDGRADERSRQGTLAAGHAGHARHEEARRGRALRGGRPRLRRAGPGAGVSRRPPAPPGEHRLRERQRAIPGSSQAS